MRLRIALPTGLLYNGEIRKVSAEAVNGAFMMLPRHIDFVTVLVPCILFFETAEEKSEEIFFAVDKSILVKRGPDVLVSTRNAVRSKDLASLRNTVHEHFEVLDEQERRARSALARMEADFVRRFLELEGRVHE
jgi:F-type H+-transporting ATPase subunit epsilon